MDFFKLIEKRRSIRKFQKRQIEPEKVAVLIESALRAPSSRSFNPWEFIFVDNPDVISQLSEAKQHGSSFLAGAPMAVAICADPEKSDVWVEDAAIASIFILLAAEALGLGGCWIQLRQRMHSAAKDSEEYVREVLKIPQQLKVEAIIAIGYPDEQKEGHSRDELQYDKISNNTYRGVL